MSELFDIPICESPRLKWISKVKAEHRIFTHYSPEEKWMAFSMSAAVKMLEGYDLKDEEKKEPMVLFGAYCRLIDEAGLITDRQETEFDAIVEICKIHKIHLWNEEGL